ncbi:calcium-binding protein [Limnospira platensis]|uniref:calcium-binding protein n=1 Tax=Limnospira platensis TaxID=118562 RepID=UPI003D6FB5E0
MRILVTIPHFFNSQGDATHGSLSKDPRPRLIGLTMGLTALRALYDQRQCIIDIGKCEAFGVNHAQDNRVDILLCTTQDCHLLNQLQLPPEFYRHCPTEAEPMKLGFECQDLLRSGLGKYDYYCYLEDDLILHDPWFFIKLAWFNAYAGDDCLLQPNRYEVSPYGLINKAYVDGDLLPHVTAKFQNIRDRPQLVGKVMEQPIQFNRSLNPHAGCYFLNNNQMEHWVKQPYFLDRDSSFVGPLESAATLGIMKSFRIYKPAPAYANFLEIQHFGSTFLSLIGKQVKLGNSPHQTNGEVEG